MSKSLVDAIKIIVANVPMMADDLSKVMVALDQAWADAEKIEEAIKAPSPITASETMASARTATDPVTGI